MMTIDERVERLTGIVESLAGTLNTLAATVLAHDNQIESLIAISEKSAANWERLERQWQVYLNTLPRN
jgi:hypothetical protein